MSHSSHLRRVGKAYLAYLAAAALMLIATGVVFVALGRYRRAELPLELAEAFAVYAVFALPVAVGVWVLAREYSSK